MNYTTVKGYFNSELPKFNYGKTEVGICHYMNGEFDGSYLNAEAVPFLYFRIQSIMDNGGAEVRLPIYTDEIDALGRFLIDLSATLRKI